MNVQIRNRWTGIVIYEGDYPTVREAVLNAVRSGAYLSRANLSGADLSGAYLSRADLSGAYLSRANLSGADLSRAYLSVANLSGADLSGAYLPGADLSGAYLSGANLSGANLSVADLSRAYLSGADLSRADLPGADLSGADLSRANLSGAYLSRAYLPGADLSGANLSGANLSGAEGVNAHLCTPLLMLYDQPGPIRAYKLTDAAGLSPMASVQIRYVVGETVAVDYADEDVEKHCGSGIHLATLDWVIKEWLPGQRIFVCEFTAADIAAIPTATDGKFRVRRCKVVEERDPRLYELVVSPAASDSCAAVQGEPAA